MVEILKKKSTATGWRYLHAGFSRDGYGSTEQPQDPSFDLPDVMKNNRSRRVEDTFSGQDTPNTENPNNQNGRCVLKL